MKQFVFEMKLNAGKIAEYKRLYHLFKPRYRYYIQYNQNKRRIRNRNAGKSSYNSKVVD